MKAEEIKAFTAEATKLLKAAGYQVMPYPGDRPKLLVTNDKIGVIVSVRPM